MVLLRSSTQGLVTHGAHTPHLQPLHHTPAKTCASKSLAPLTKRAKMKSFKLVLENPGPSSMCMGMLSSIQTGKVSLIRVSIQRLRFSYQRTVFISICMYVYQCINLACPSLLVNAHYHIRPHPGVGPKSV